MVAERIGGDGVPGLDCRSKHPASVSLGSLACSWPSVCCPLGFIFFSSHLSPHICLSLEVTWWHYPRGGSIRHGVLSGKGEGGEANGEGRASLGFELTVHGPALWQ